MVRRSTSQTREPAIIDPCGSIRQPRPYPSIPSPRDIGLDEYMSNPNPGAPGPVPVNPSDIDCLPQDPDLGQVLEGMGRLRGGTQPSSYHAQSTSRDFLSPRYSSRQGTTSQNIGRRHSVSSVGSDDYRGRPQLHHITTRRAATDNDSCSDNYDWDFFAAVTEKSEMFKDITHKRFVLQKAQQAHLRAEKLAEERYEAYSQAEEENLRAEEAMKKAQEAYETPGPDLRDTGYTDDAYRQLMRVVEDYIRRGIAEVVASRRVVDVD
jgi:hypothetical protein